MADRKGTGILVVMADVPAEMEEEFNRWYNEEHIGELTSLPGVLNAARYEAISGSPKHLAVYEMESPDVYSSEAFQHYLANPGEWSRRMSPRVIGQNYVHNVYQVIYPEQVLASMAGSDMAPILQYGRMGIPEQYEEEFNAWYSTVYVPNYCAVPGVIQARRLSAVRGAPAYGVMYEFENEKVPQTPEWEKARDANPWSLRIRPKMEHANGSPGVYRKTFQLG